MLCTHIQQLSHSVDVDQLYGKNALYQKVLAARAAAGPGNAYDLEWTDPSTGRTKMSHPLNLPFTSLTVVPTAEQANPVAYRAFWLPGRNFSFVGSIVTRKGDLLELCGTEGVDITDATGNTLTVAGLRAALRLHYTELYKDDPNLIGIPTTAQPLVDRINARGAADGAPTPTDARGPRRPRPSGAAAAQDPRPRKRRRVGGRVPPAVAAAAAAEARFMAELENDGSSSEEDFDVVPRSPPRRRSSRHAV